MMLAGSIGCQNATATIGDFELLIAEYNGASSQLYVNEVAGTNVNVGANDMNGFTVGKQGQGGSYGNFEVKEIVLRDKIDSAGDKADIIAYLKAEHSLSY